MARRKKFLLVFSSDPSAADVVRSDFVLDPEMAAEGAEVTFRWEKAKDTFEEIVGKVIMIGLKKNMAAVNLDEAGNVIGEKGVGTRKQELEKRKMQKVNAQQLQLQEMAQQLLTDGAGAVSDQLQPVLKVRRPCLPKKRSAAVLSKVTEMVAGMECFSPGSMKSELFKDRGIYCDSGKLAVARLRYRRRPDALHRAILKLCIPTKILRHDGISATGKRECVAINPLINETIALYVIGTYKAAGGKLHDTVYDPVEILTNLIDNCKREHGVWRILEDTEESENNSEVTGVPPSEPPVATQSEEHTPPRSVPSSAQISLIQQPSTSTASATTEPATPISEN